MSKTYVNLLKYTEPGDSTYSVNVTSVADGMTESDASVTCRLSRSSGDLKYALNGDGNAYTVTGIGSADPYNLEIPATYNDLPVTAISDNAFAGIATIKQVTLGSNIITIGANAFKECSNLETLDFSAATSLYTIKASAFENCVKLPGVTLPGSLYAIEDNAFKNCLLDCDAIDIFNNGDGAALFSIGSYAFANTGLKGSLVIPRSVDFIGNGTFAGTKIKTVTIYGPIEDWGSAFENCTNLETAFFLENSIRYIPERAFKGCTELVGVKIPASCICVEPYAFAGCTKLGYASIDEIHGYHFTIKDGWIFGNVMHRPTTDDYYVPLGFKGVNVWKFLSLVYPDRTFWRTNKIPAPVTNLDGPNLTITDYSRWAENFNIYVNGSQVDTIKAEIYEIPAGEYIFSGTFREFPEVNDFIYFRCGDMRFIEMRVDATTITFIEDDLTEHRVFANNALIDPNAKFISVVEDTIVSYEYFQWFSTYFRLNV